MDTPSREIPLGSSSEKISEGQHICHIYNDDERLWNTIARFLEGGYSNDEEVRYLVDDLPPAEFPITFRLEG